MRQVLEAKFIEVEPGDIILRAYFKNCYARVESVKYPDKIHKYNISYGHLVVTISELKLRGFWLKGLETKYGTIKKNALDWDDPVIISREV